MCFIILLWNYRFTGSCKEMHREVPCLPPWATPTSHMTTKLSKPRNWYWDNQSDLFKFPWLYVCLFVCVCVCVCVCVALHNVTCRLYVSNHHGGQDTVWSYPSHHPFIVTPLLPVAHPDSQYSILLSPWLCHSGLPDKWNPAVCILLRLAFSLSLTL